MLCADDGQVALARLLDTGYWLAPGSSAPEVCSEPSMENAAGEDGCSGESLVVGPGPSFGAASLVVCNSSLRMSLNRKIRVSGIRS